MLQAWREKRAARKADKKKKALGFLRENVEALTVAVVMALLIKQFAFEAFKVPTESMEPTIIGRADGGYRLIVNKFVYLLRDPRRSEIVVFQYPHNRLVNYVKRVVGMPEEWLFLRNGDVYTADYELDREAALASAAIYRKPQRLQQRIFDISSQIPPQDREVDKFRRYWKLEEGDRGHGDIAVDKDEGTVAIDGGPGLTLVRFTRPANQLTADGNPVPVLNNRRYDDWSFLAEGSEGFGRTIGFPYPALGRGAPSGRIDETGDVRLTFEVNPNGAKEVVVEILDGTHGRPLRLFLTSSGSSRATFPETVGGEAVEHAIDARLDGWTEVSVSNADDAITVFVDGDEAWRHEYTHTPIEPNEPVLAGGETTAPLASRTPPAVQPTIDLPHDNAVLFGCVGGKAQFRDIDVARDVYYTYAGATDYHIPADRYLMLGDNSTDSLDGRGWKVSRMEYRTEDGEVVTLEGDAEGVSTDETKPRPFENPYTDKETGEMHFIDAQGNTWDIDPERVVKVEKGEETLLARTFFGHLVPRRYMLGRAYVTFWPLAQVDVIR